jgi:predicted ATPase
MSSSHNKSGPYIRELRLDSEAIPSPATFPFNLPAIASLTTLALHPLVTFFVGENGSGKSTVLEAIAEAWGFSPEGGSLNFKFSTHKARSVLADHITLVKNGCYPRTEYFLRAESFYNVATEIERLDEDDSGGGKIVDYYGGTSLHNQSHGESFLSLLMHRLDGDGLYLFDEPEAALSPTRQLAMLARMQQLVDNGSQLIIATHSPILLAFPQASIFNFSASGILPIAYKDTEQYQVTKFFLNNPEGMLAKLMVNTVDR